MKIRWFLVGLIGSLCLAAPAEAGKLASWQFDLGQSRLEASTDNSVTQVEEVRVTADGLFIKTTGASPEITAESRRDRRRHRETRTIEFTIDQAILSPQMLQQSIAINRYGISQLEFSQTDDQPSSVKIIMNVAPDSPEWQASASSLGGIVLLPQGGASAVARFSISDSDSSSLSTAASASSAVTVAPPQSSPASPPPSNRPTPLLLTPPHVTPRSGSPRPSSDRLNPNSPPNNFQDRQITVVLDPGHGGRDPGAVGINGIHEADIVLPIAQQVAALLEEQGV